MNDVISKTLKTTTKVNILHIINIIIIITIPFQKPVYPTTDSDPVDVEATPPGGSTPSNDDVSFLYLPHLFTAFYCFPYSAPCLLHLYIHFFNIF